MGEINERKKRDEEKEKLKRKRGGREVRRET